MKPPMLAIMARSTGTGKTTVMERLIAGLTGRGWRVGAVKHGSHRLKLDCPGKDSWRYAQSGARSVAVLSEKKYAVIQQIEAEIAPEEAAGMLRDVDIILIEGYKYGSTPKIEVIRKEKGLGILAAPQDLVAVVTDTPEIQAPAPVFSFEEVSELVDLVEKQFLREKKLQGNAAQGELTHFDPSGRPRMVDVTEKDTTTREATAYGEISMHENTLQLVKAGGMSKGDVLAVAQVAAVSGVKETGRLIPMCHPLLIGGVSVDFKLDEKKNKIEVRVTVKISGQTGVEMEALTGVSTALLTIYDMCKAVDKNMVIGKICLLEKKGGRSGHYQRTT